MNSQTQKKINSKCKNESKKKTSKKERERKKDNGGAILPK